MRFTGTLKFITAFSLLSFCLTGCVGAAVPEDAAGQYDPDQTYVLCSGDISEYISATGKLSSADEVRIQGLNEVPVSSVFVRKGDIVKQGDKLFSYDFEKLHSELDELRQEYSFQSEYTDYRHSLNCRNLEQTRSAGDMSVSRAQAEVEKAENDLDEAYFVYNSIIDDINSAAGQFPQTDEGKAALETRYSELELKREAAAEKITLSETAVVQAERLLESARHEYEINVQNVQDNIDAEKYDTSLSKLNKQIRSKEEQIVSDTVTAPVDGIVSELNVSAEGMIRGESAVTITSCDRLTASVQVGRSDICNVTMGSKAELIIGNRSDPVTASVSRVSHIAEKDTDTFTVELTPDDNFTADGVFLGMDVTAKIYVRKKDNILKAPYTCIRTDNGQDYYVLKIRKNSEGIMETVRLSVQVGISSATEAEIFSDELDNGDILLMK